MRFGPSAWRTPEIGMQREWLLANGLGGYASTALTGANGRRYHGLLIAAPGAGRERHLVLSQISEAVVSQNQYRTLLAFHTREQYYRGEEYLTEFTWDGMPVWRYRIGRLTLEKQVVLVHRKNQVVVRYRAWNGSDAVSLHLTPLVNFRNHHFLSYNQYTQFKTEFDGRRMCVHPFGSPDVIRIECTDGAIEHLERSWFYNMDYPLDRLRGQPATEDHFLPGSYQIDLEPGAVRTISLSVSLNEPFEALDGDAVIQAEANRLAELPLRQHPDPFVRSLAQAADQFLVCHAEHTPGTPPKMSDAVGAQLCLEIDTTRSGQLRSPWGVSCGAASRLVPLEHGCAACDLSIIAGYPWIGPWGRDTLIALPGLLLLTGRHQEAGRLLRQMAERVRQGMLDNPLLPERNLGSEKAVDAPLWLFEALWRHVRQSADLDTAAAILPVLEEIIRAHAESRVAGVVCDTDGLLRITTNTESLTWMNARVGNWIVTPRIGKPVEINALWYNALCVLDRIRERLMAGEPDAHEPDALRQPGAFAETVRRHFESSYWNPGTACLFDVVDGDEPDAAIRPNQVLACSLSFPVMQGGKARLAMETVFHRLLTPMGLRSLSPEDSRYKGQHLGDQYAREGAMHQGTVWPWLLGSFATAWRRTHEGEKDVDEVLAAMFIPLRDHLQDGCLNTISELADGQFPHEPRGCVSQAWSVAEVLRGYLEEVVDRSTVQLDLLHPESNSANTRMHPEA